MKITDMKKIHGLSILLMACYFISYITRINYGAVISEMESARHISKSLLSLALSGSAVTYAAGQLISGFLGDRIQPKKLIFTGLLTTILTNLSLPFADSIKLTIAIWCVNGLAQAFMWPPIVKIMTSLLMPSDYSKCCIVVSWGSCLGTIAVYLVSPLIISAASWKEVFLVSAAAAAVFACIWLKFCPKVEITPVTKTNEKHAKPDAKLFTPLLFIIMFTIILQGSLRDGVTTWMPSLISESYHMSNSTAILSGVLLPIFSMFCFSITEKLYRKNFRNIMTCAGVIYAAMAAAGLMLVFTFGKNPIFSIIGCMLVSGCTHGINIIFTSFTPPYFSKSGKPALVSGILNSCTYIGSSVSVYGFAKITENTSWNTTLILWFAIAALGTLICLSSSKRWKREMMNK